MVKQADKRDALGEVTLPLLPESLQRIQAEQAQAEPDIGQIVSIIADDASLAAEVLKTINSPLFRRRQPLSSIPKAVMLLGLNNVLNIASTHALRAALLRCPSGQPSFERFWESAGETGMCAALLAQEVSGVPPDMAYTLGLFSECGIPIMMCRYGDYAALLKEGEAGLREREQARYGFDHARVAYLVSRSWNLPPAISDAIRQHHDFARLVMQDEGRDDLVVSLVGLLKMAEYIRSAYRKMMFPNSRGDEEWKGVADMVLSHFELEPSDFADLREQVNEQLDQR